MREQVLRYIRRCGLMKAGERVLVAVSGGADSVALLRVLLELREELGLVLAVAHFNHRLRGADSDADEEFVLALARRLELHSFAERGDVAEYAAAQRFSLETAGRELRYRWLTKVAVENRADAIATAHTLDDQAETVLMKFLRGAGSRGLAGIYPTVLREAGIRLVRPLLGTSRIEVEHYLESIGQEWREDESNLDRRFFRNRVRHELLPLLEREYNPNLREVLSERAEINREEESYWDEVVASARKQVSYGERRINLVELGHFAVAVQRRLLKRWLEELAIPCDTHHVEAVRQCALGAIAQVELPGNWAVCRTGDHLVLQPQGAEPDQKGYSYQLTVPGELKLNEIGCTLRIVPVPAAFAAEADPGTLLRADAIGTEVRVRNWQPGDRFHVAYTGKERKLKTLFLERKIAAVDRPLWPLMVKGTDVVWVRDLPVGEAFCWRPGDGNALRVECSPL